MNEVVVDASMALAWHFTDEDDPATFAIEAMTDDTRLVVPSHWPAEIANALHVGERRRRATVAQSAHFIERLRTLDIEVEQVDPYGVWERVLPLARAYALTVYDTLYLELAQRRGLPLASLDTELVAAARDAGVAIVGDPA